MGLRNALEDERRQGNPDDSLLQGEERRGKGRKDAHEPRPQALREARGKGASQRPEKRASGHA